MGKGQEGDSKTAGAEINMYCFEQVNVEVGETTSNLEQRVEISDDLNITSKARSTCCTGQRFDCIEKKLRHVFAAWGRVISRHPWPTFLLPMLLTTVLSSGFLFIKMETNQDVLYTPMNGRAKIERRIVEDLFEKVAWESQTTPARLTKTGRYVHVIFTRKDGKSVLSSDVLDKVLKVHQTVVTYINVGSEDASYDYTDLCIMWRETCLENNVLSLYKNNTNHFVDGNITYPYTFLPDGNVAFVGAELGGVELWNEDGFEPEFCPVKSASAFRLLYYLKSKAQFDELSSEFESFVMQAVHDISSDWEDVSAVPFASRTPDDEVNAATFDSVSLFPIAAALLLVFTVGSCMTKDSVRSKPWLAIAAIVSTLLAMISAPGLLFLFGVPFVDMAAAMPFIILGRGLDDAFIMLSAWRQTDTKLSVERRMSFSLSEAVMSITATTVTDTLAFMIGAVSDFLSVRIFCLHTGLAVIFDYIYQITFFAACMVFSGRREAENRHCVTMRRVSVPSIDSKPSPGDTMGKYSYSNQSSVRRPTAGHKASVVSGKVDHAFMTFFRDKFGPLIMHPWIKVVVFLVYVGYIGIAIWGCLQIQQGLQEQNLVRENSEASQFLDLKYAYFKTYEPPVSLVIETEQNYWETETQNIINTTLSELESDVHFHDPGLTVSWLHEYKRFLGLVGIANITKDLFIDILRKQFLKIPAFEPFKLDIVFDDTNTSITSSRYFVMGKNLSTSEDQKAMMLTAREIAANCELSAVVYSPSFVYYDQFVAVLPTAIQNMVLAIGSIIFASFLLIPSATCCIWVIIAVVSILLGVIGYMTLWNVNLHSITLLTLILSVGFSVDYTIHITSSFVSSPWASRRKRAVHALYSVGMPIVQGSLSTMFAIFLFAFSTHYAFRVFFKSLTLVIVFGMAHGLVFLPVVLSVLGPQSTPVAPLHEPLPTSKHKLKQNEGPS